MKQAKKIKTLKVEESDYISSDVAYTYPYINYKLRHSNSSMQKNGQLPFLDFFAGSGLVSEGLKAYFTPVWANDISEKKAAVFTANHPKEIFKLRPIEEIKGSELPSASLSWASFPCQDLSLAGNMGGLSRKRSGLVWEWLRVMDEMNTKPAIVVAENVVGLMSLSNGTHYRQLHGALLERDYKVGAVIIDASCWVPQSRKRVFVIAVDKTIDTTEFESMNPLWCHPASLQSAVKSLSEWVWWRIPQPRSRSINLENIIDLDAPSYDHERKTQLLNLIPEKHREKIEIAYSEGCSIFPGYKRIRNGRQVLELRFDSTAGCLRTPRGGSSRQFLVIRQNGSWKTRLLTVREAAKLMGVRNSYKIPGSYNDGYMAMGDAVAVPVTRYIARYLLSPLAHNADK
jgi:DNA (cytosine-5)-methyltransferase 1